MEFSDVIKNRYSCKKFSSEQIGKDKLDAILEAGRVAPTAKNLQEQHIYVVQSESALETIDKLTPCRYNVEDQWLLVLHKPEGVLSVPGKSEEQSIYSLLRARYPEATGPLVVHRLDMATSGLLLAAKTQEVHRHLQAQFENRSIKKRYIALLDGILPEEEGVIDLPICPDYLDRPRQMVNEELGKTAITRYRVMDRKNGQTRIAFFPLTGRTHQLRVHAAHPLGLNCPIVGDELYGRKAERLYLHAEYLEFIHPVSGQRMVIEKKAEF